ncbi:MAG: GNAT family N-acetyltransferase [Chloroflexota bacterium]
MEIRQAQTGDAEVLHGIVQAAFGEYRGVLAVPPSALGETLEEVREAVLGGQVLVAWDGDRAVGTVRYEVQPEHLYVGRLAVLPEYRGHSIGAALMGYLEELAPRLGLRRMRLGTRASMEKNIVFYERLGYTIVKQEPHTSGPDVWVWFEKELDAAR